MFLVASSNNNKSEGSDWSDYAVFKTRNSSDVSAQDCAFEGNEMDHLVGGNTPVTVKNCTEAPSNSFRKGRVDE